MQRNFLEEPFTGKLKLCLPPQSAKTIPLMDADQVKKIPPDLLSWTWSIASDVQDLDDITVVTVKGATYHLRIQRVVDWFLKREDAFFFSKAKLDIVRPDENNKRCTIPYDPKTHANDPTCHATVKSHTYFTEEVEVYKFSLDTNLTELQAVLSKRLCSQFPVYVAELITLFKTLRVNDVTVSVKGAQHFELLGALLTFGFRDGQTPFDPDLTRFILGQIQALRGAIAEDEHLLAYLRTSLPTEARLQSLLCLQPTPEAMAKAVEALSSGITKSGEAKALLETFVDKYLKIPQPSPTVPTGPADRRMSDHRTGDAMIIFNAIYRDNRLVISDREGRGTMRSTRSGGVLPNARADDFRVSRGELLITLPGEVSQSKSSGKIVCNRHGEIGELLQDLRLTPFQEVYSMSWASSYWCGY
jgi:hypothetical protein